MPKLGATILGYVLACLSVGITYPLSMGALPDIGGSFSVALLTGVYALPGFVIIRTVMWMASAKRVLVFVAAGALNALLSMVVLLPSIVPQLLLCGAIAGFVCLWAEQFIMGRWPERIKVMDQT